MPTVAVAALLQVMLGSRTVNFPLPENLRDRYSLQELVTMGNIQLTQRPSSDTAYVFFFVTNILDKNGHSPLVSCAFGEPNCMRRYAMKLLARAKCHCPSHIASSPQTLAADFFRSQYLFPFLNGVFFHSPPPPPECRPCLPYLFLSVY